jgi:alpha-1,2-mannosyltransferase
MVTGLEARRRNYVLARIVALAIAFGILATIQVVYFHRGFIPGDAFTYLAAGERLNDGHPLYALSPGDRPVGINPPFWTVPLLSPPLIAVLMRPFALLPDDVGAYAWWAVCLAAMGGSVFALIRRKPITTAIAVAILSIPIAYEIGVGNVNALILAMLVGAWYSYARGRDGATGFLLAAATVLKVTPGVTLWWLVTQRRWSGVRAFVVAGIALSIVSILGAGIAAHLEYVGIARRTLADGSSDLSSAGIARFFGVPGAAASVLPTILMVVGLVAIWLARARPGLAYGVAVVAMLAGSPIVNVNWFSLLLAILAPLAWPVPSDAAPRDETATGHGDAQAGHLGSAFGQGR